MSESIKNASIKSVCHLKVIFSIPFVIKVQVKYYQAYTDSIKQNSSYFIGYIYSNYLQVLSAFNSYWNHLIDFIVLNL